MSTTEVNYSSLLGIQSLPAAVVFIILYVPLALYFTWRAATKFSRIFVFLTTFCLVRIAGFAIRAVLAGETSTGSNLGLNIADQILFGVGYTGLLYAAVSLQVDWERMTGLLYQHPVLLVFTNRRFFHVAIVAAVALTIAGVNMLTSSTSSTRDVGNTLRTAGTWLIFALTLLQGSRSGMFIFWERSKNRSSLLHRTSFVDAHVSSLLALISAILLFRMIYSVITVHDVQHEPTWYPLEALPELLSVCVFATPGLILSRVEMQEKTSEMSGYRNEPVIPPTVV